MLTRILRDYGFFQSALITASRDFIVSFFVDYSQNELIDKINGYLKQQNRRLILRGYCHGLTLLWLKRMSQRREEEFYAVIKKIVDCPDDDLHTIAADIEKIRLSLDKKQNPDRHFFYCAHRIRHNNVDVILKTEKQTTLDGIYTRSGLAGLLESQVMNGFMLCISSCFTAEESDDNHSIGVYKRDDCYYVYDTNNASGCAETSRSSYVVVNLILKCLYGNFNMAEPEEFQLEIKLIADGRKKGKRYSPGMECGCLSKKTRQI